ncbi:Subtilisin-like serine protease Cla h [Fulvia fulva]|uniref:Subtilisin-like serine protease Cla h n=1 Tax=Passalora fulva TaxID=5499 RepID=A0A9Q8LH11_PASFU|nr:Subtilisin-like serine protease Cla h [Fulvia fulva]KAK4624690.1 Subtilisin-like serine protease Cla h [Fulvia fulva]KAK4625348.1 Subtilisin-like serine protease Cla h [Fulvia fulva]UJO17238.1 Subtilisin-like serine protease Cla h [Fulvia fulva]WPV15607.1 Subtilisin-like serine protease Cla h [Fulvia fulva]WPV29700.1 Subtilisin-like serine protease Cla h [Fulvia fulva]
MKSFIAFTLPLLAAASPVLHEQSIHGDAAPIISSANAKEIPDSYIIKFKKHVTTQLAADHHDWVKDIHLGVQSRKTELKKRSQIPMVDDIFHGLKHTYNIAGSYLGYSGHFDEDVIEQIRRHPDVEMIERDQEVHTLGHSDEGELEKNAPWGLARISHRDSLSFGSFNKYLYSADGGEGVDVYVIDTGTNTEHVDFEGRAEWGKTIPSGDADEDGNGHGTHCSGTVAGKKYGVAKKAHIKAVKVLRSNGSGSMSDVVKGVEYAANAHNEQVSVAKKGKRKGFKGSAANMSLGGGKSPLLDQAVNAAVDAGIHFAVAAGNDNADSCNYSPAAADQAVTVGASTLADERAYFSNYGKCNDIFAPGLNIQSTWIGSKYAINTISGTSMASPHIAGLLAYYLSLQPAKDSAYAVAEITPKQLKKNLIAVATEGALTDVPSNTANILAWNGGGSSSYSDIVDKGSYKVDNKAALPVENLKEKAKEVVESFEELEEKLMKDVKDFIREIKNA